MRKRRNNSCTYHSQHFNKINFSFLAAFCFIPHLFYNNDHKLITLISKANVIYFKLALTSRKRNFVCARTIIIISLEVDF